MEKQTSIDIVRNLLATKDSMEKTHEFASNTMRKTREMNPLYNIRILQLHQNILNVKHSENEAKKSAVVELTRLLSGTPKAIYCHKCRTKITPDTTFCGNCGTKVTKFKF